MRLLTRSLLHCIVTVTLPRLAHRPDRRSPPHKQAADIFGEKMAAMYPMTLLKFSRYRRITLELSSGVKVAGKLMQVDPAMNLHIQNPVYTMQDGRKASTQECYIRGPAIRFIRVDYKLMRKQSYFD